MINKVLVDLPTILLDFTIWFGEGPDVAHLDHGPGEVGAEGARAAGISPHERVGGTAIEELLVGVKQALFWRRFL